MRFEDKVAIVTGGASGIGKEVATRVVRSSLMVATPPRPRRLRERLTRRASVSPCTQATSLYQRPAKRW